jgi:hypothetical protein
MAETPRKYSTRNVYGGFFTTRTAVTNFAQGRVTLLPIVIIEM